MATLDDVYNYLQAPYRARQRSGQVVTPGPVDWGGIYHVLQAPYEARMARERGASGPVESTKSGRYQPTAFDNPGPGVAQGGSDPWAVFNNYVNDDPGYPVRSMAQINSDYGPTAAQYAALRDTNGVPTSHTAIATNERLTGTPSPYLAFAPNAPGVDAISGAIMPPMPIPRPTPPGVFGPGQHGEIRRGTDGNTYQYVQATGDVGGNGQWTWSRMADPGGVDLSQIAPDGLRPDGTYGGPQTGFAADPVNVTVNGGVRMPMGAPIKRKVTPAVPQGPGANGRPGAGNIRNNPTKYGKTQQDRNDYANARQAFLASWGVT